MKNFNGEPIKKALRAIATILGAAVLVKEIKEGLLENDPDIRKVASTYSMGYGDAVEAIMDSDMFSSTKSNAIATLKSDADDEYYKAVVCIAKSDMFDSEKLDTIKRISK